MSNDGTDSAEDYALDPSFPVDPDEVIDQTNEKTSGVTEVVKSRIIGYHFGGLHFWPGRDGVKGVYVGDPGIPGMVSVKVAYKGTGKRNSIFTVPMSLIVIEEEELPILIASSLDDIKS